MSSNVNSLFVEENTVFSNLGWRMGEGGIKRAKKERSRGSGGARTIICHSLASKTSTAHETLGRYKTVISLSASYVHKTVSILGIKEISIKRPRVFKKGKLSRKRKNARNWALNDT